MTAYLAGMLRLAGQHHEDLLAHLNSWAVVAGIGVATVITICLLRGPVMTDKFLAAFGNIAGKYGPKMFYVAVGVLIVGIVINEVGLIIIGASLAGTLLLGLFAWHY